jgi:hypothetical protein
MPRQKIHASPAARVRACRHNQKLKRLAPDAVCRTIGPCTLYCSPCELIYDLLPRHAAIVTDPPYKVGKTGDDVTNKSIRRSVQRQG